MLVVEQVCVGMSADQVRGRDDAVAALLSIEDSGGGRGLRRRQMRRLRLLLLMLELLLLVVLVVVIVVVLGGCDAACDRLIQLFHFRALPPKPKQSLPLAQTQGRRWRPVRPSPYTRSLLGRPLGGRADATPPTIKYLCESD